MTLEESLFSALSTYAPLTDLVGQKIFPTDQPPFGIAPPWIYYTVVDREPEGETLEGDPRAVLCQVEIDILGKDYQDGRAIASALYSCLHKYRGGQINRAFWSGSQSDPIEEGYHFTERFTVRVGSEVVSQVPNSLCRVQTGTNLFRVLPGGSVNRFEATDQGGSLAGTWTLNGQPIATGSIDLSAYAKLTANTFTGTQTVSGNGNRVIIGNPGNAGATSGFRVVISIDPSSGVNGGLVIQGSAGASGDPLVIQGNSGNVIHRFQNNGAYQFTTLQAIGEALAIFSNGTFRWFSGIAGTDRPEISPTADGQRGLRFYSGLYANSGGFAHRFETGQALGSGDWLQGWFRQTTQVGGVSAFGAIQPGLMADNQAPTNSLYRSSDRSGKLCWKNTSGTITELAT